MTIETLKSPNSRNRNSISVLKSIFLSVSSMNTLLVILKVTDARCDVILAGGLYHRFPWRYLPPLGEMFESALRVGICGPHGNSYSKIFERLLTNLKGVHMTILGGGRRLNGIAETCYKIRRIFVFSLRSDLVPSGTLSSSRKPLTNKLRCRCLGFEV